MLELTIEVDGHDLSPTMWVLPDTAPPPRQGENVRAGIVEQQDQDKD
jgi:hypothetical protein